MGQHVANQWRDDEQRTLRHDMRTPVNHIVSFADLVREDAENRGLDSLVDEMEAVATAGGAALRLIDSLLESRLDPSTSQPSPARAELAALMDEVTRRIAQASDDPAVRAAPAIGADLDRIGSAAQRLLALVRQYPVTQ